MSCTCDQSRHRKSIPAIATLGTLLCALSGCSGQKNEPQLYYSEAAADLGILDPSRSNPFSIRLMNGGNVALKIDSVSSSCTCTIEEPPKTIEPGGHGFLRGQVRVQSGPGSSELRIVSNDPRTNQIIRLRWTGRGIPTLIPNSIRFSSIQGAAIEAGLEICYPSGVPFELLGTSGLPSGWSLVLVNDLPTAMQTDPYISPTSAIGRATLRLKGVAPSTLGESKIPAVVAIRYGGERQELRLSIEIEAHDGLRALPKKLLFSSDTLDGLLGLERSVVLQTADSGDEVRVVTKPPYLAVTFDRRSQVGRPGKLSRLVMKARIASPPPLHFDRAEVEIRDSAGHKVIIPILVSFN